MNPCLIEIEERTDGDGLGYFAEALSDFVQNFAYGDAIRHLADRGYTAERIEKEFHYPISREKLNKILDDYQRQKKAKGL